MAENGRASPSGHLQSLRGPSPARARGRFGSFVSPSRAGVRETSGATLAGAGGDRLSRRTGSRKRPQLRRGGDRSALKVDLSVPAA
jgi:hypothetical protein